MPSHANMHEDISLLRNREHKRPQVKEICEYYRLAPMPMVYFIFGQNALVTMTCPVSLFSKKGCCSKGEEGSDTEPLITVTTT